MKASEKIRKAVDERLMCAFCGQRPATHGIEEYASDSTAYICEKCAEVPDPFDDFSWPWRATAEELSRALLRT